MAVVTHASEKIRSQNASSCEASTTRSERGYDQDLLAVLLFCELVLKKTGGDQGGAEVGLEERQRWKQEVCHQLFVARSVVCSWLIGRVVVDVRFCGRRHGRGRADCDGLLLCCAPLHRLLGGSGQWGPAR